MRPTFFLFGSPDPASILMALLIRDDAGGVLVIKVNDLSSNTVMTAGMTRPALSLVLSYNRWHNPMILTRFSPRAGPTGGAGVAFPLSICTRADPTIFFAIAD